MLDNTYLNPPSMLQDIEAATAEMSFTLSSEPLTGSLLRALAASKPSGALLELGTGTGMGTAWILQGMDASARLISVDANERTTAVARRYLGHDPRVTFQLGDGAAFILSCSSASFDFIFADTWPGKFYHLTETLHLLKPGGLYIVDDLSPRPDWEENRPAQVQQLIATLEQQPDLFMTRLNWATGLIIATKR